MKIQHKIKIDAIQAGYFNNNKQELYSDITITLDHQQYELEKSVLGRVGQNQECESCWRERSNLDHCCWNWSYWNWNWTETKTFPSPASSPSQQSSIFC
jgi:hypothetical protein